MDTGTIQKNAAVIKIKKGIKISKGQIKESFQKSQVTVKGFIKRGFSRFRRLVPRFVHNNDAILLTGETAFPEMLASMEKAKRSINIEMYIFKDDYAGNLVAKTLKEKSRKGVVVNVLYDSYGSRKTSNEFFEDLRRAGVKVAEHNSINPIKSLRSAIFDINNRDHRKIIVIDGKIAFLGGMNFAKEYYKNWNDVMVKIEGPVVREIQLKFFKQWQVYEHRPLGNKKIDAINEINSLEKKYKGLYFPELRPAGNKVMGLISGSPLKTRRAIHDLYSDAMENARESIIIETPYFVPTKKLMKKMLKKLKQGVSMKIVVADNNSSDIPSLNLVSYYYLAPLLKAGAKVYSCVYKNKILHAKLFVVDNYVTIVGSSNLDSRSFKHNYEINTVIFNREFAENTIKKINGDILESKPFNEKMISQLSLKEKIISSFYWAVKSLL